MSELLERLLEQSKALSSAEKTLLAERLLGETALADPQWEEAWAVECEGRLKALEEGTTESVPWEDVRQRVFGR